MFVSGNPTDPIKTLPTQKNLFQIQQNKIYFLGPIHCFSKYLKETENYPKYFATIKVNMISQRPYNV